MVMKLVSAFVAVLAVAGVEAFPAAAGGPVPETPAAVGTLLAESLVPPRARFRGGGRWVRELTGRFRLERAVRVDESLMMFLERHREAFGLDDPRNELLASRTETAGGMSRVVFQQVSGGLPVWGATLEMDVDGDGALVLAVSRVGPSGPVKAEPAFTRAAAYGAVSAEWKKYRDTPMPPAGIELVIYRGRLAYNVKVREVSEVWYFLVDAAEGGVVHAEKAASEKGGHCDGM